MTPEKIEAYRKESKRNVTMALREVEDQKFRDYIDGHKVELHICQHCPCDLDSKQCCINRTLLSENRIQGYQCRVLRYRHNQGMIEG